VRFGRWQPATALVPIGLPGSSEHVAMSATRARHGPLANLRCACDAQVKYKVFHRMLKLYPDLLLEYAKTGDGDALRTKNNPDNHCHLLKSSEVKAEEWALKLASDLFGELLATEIIFDGIYTGFGRATLVGRACYVGSFVSGDIEGPGLYRLLDGGHTYGTFKDGVLHGHDGTLVEINSAGGKNISRGEFKNGNRERMISYTEGEKQSRLVQYCKDKPVHDTPPAPEGGKKKARKRGISSTNGSGRKTKAAKAAAAAGAEVAAVKVKADAEVAAAKVKADAEVAAAKEAAKVKADAEAQTTHSYSYTVYDKRYIAKHPDVVPVQYLGHEVVCGTNPAISAKDLTFIDGAVLLVAFVSPIGETEPTQIGCRMVSYFEPLKMAVLNTTVIFDAHKGQKNLDPLQKITSQYIRKTYPDATRIAVVTNPGLNEANWNNYTKNGFPWSNDEGTYDYLKMINIDDASYEQGGEHDAGSDDAWEMWTDGKTRNIKGWNTLVSGGYGKHGQTLVAMLPREEEEEEEENDE
jgi:hypothetical protein